MPALYEHIRDYYVKKGLSLRQAKRRAAMTWNKLFPDNPNPWTREGKKRKK